MDTIKDILENKEIKLQVCKFCGKEYRLYEQVLFKGTPNERITRLQVPNCNCIDENAKREELAAAEAAKKERLKKLFDNSLMTPFFKRKTFTNLTKTKELETLEKYVAEFKPHKSPGIYMVGNVGTGKTTALAAVSNALIEKGYKVLFTTLSALLDRFTKHSFENSGDIMPLLKWLTEFDLVVIDDIGRENYTEKRKEVAFRIIDQLLNWEVVTAITANPEMIAKLKEMPEWGATLDRLKDVCGLTFKMAGNSLRGQKWQ